MKFLLNKKNDTLISEILENHSSFIEINTEAWEHNITSYRNIMSADTQLGVVLKSNAYGHGIDTMSQLAQNNIFIDWILVVSSKEAVHLKTNGIKKNILILSILDEYLEESIIHGCSVVIYSSQSALRVLYYAQMHNITVNVHIKIDTGLSRLGITIDEAPSFLAWISSFKWLLITGIFTHFSSAEHKDDLCIIQQHNQLNSLIDYYSTTYKRTVLSHSACSAAIGRLDHGGMVRLGISAYGIWPSNQIKELFESMYPTFYLRPILSWKTRIIQIKYIKAGTPVGYNKTFVAQQPMRIATIGVGYYDGLDRRLSNKGCVMVNEHQAPIIGKVSMNLTTIDITHINNVRLGNIVELVGAHSAISIKTHAEKCDTISYDFVTQLGAHIIRKCS